VPSSFPSTSSFLVVHRRELSALAKKARIPMTSPQVCCDEPTLRPLETWVQRIQVSPCVQDLRCITVHTFLFNRFPDNRVDTQRLRLFLGQVSVCLPPNEVGHRRGTSPALFRCPLPKLYRPVSEHTAFQRTHIIALGISKDLRIARPCNPSSSDLFLLLPFALRPDLPISLVRCDPHDSYGSSVTICLATGR
jgi:hypothetical protein